jgi:hypothetical protein
MTLAQEMLRALKIECLANQTRWTQEDLDWVWVHARPPFGAWPEKPSLEQAHAEARAKLADLL